MSKPSRNYDSEFKSRIIRLVLEEGRTIPSINEEYTLGEGTVRNWIKKFQEECEANPGVNDTKNLYDENRRLRKELDELKKENTFLKKAAAFFAKAID